MWNDSKRDTEVDKVRREVERKRRIAEEEGLDRLLLEAYHGSVRYYPLWIKSDKEKVYVYPGVSKATERIEKNPSGDVFITEFSIGATRYRLTSERRGNILAHDLHYVITLFVNDAKAFAVSEKHDVRLKGAHYYTLNIEAYVNEDWVEDFRNILEHQDRVAKTIEEVPAEDHELVDRLKSDFNVGGSGERIIRTKPWPRYKVYRLLLLLIILALTLTAFIEFKTLVH